MPDRAPRHGRAPRRTRRTLGGAAALATLVAVALTAAACGGGGSGNAAGANTGTNASTSSSQQTAPPAPSTTTTTLPPPGPGFVAGQVTAVGDSVMLDYQEPLQADIPGVTVDAAVSRQWSDGEQILQQLKSADQLGATVIVGLGTNGPITASDFDAMMSTLSGASRVVFVNTHVDQPWQDQVNSVLQAGVARYPNTVLVDWNALASQHPSWFGSDGTHIAIGGTGADELASLIAQAAATGKSPAISSATPTTLAPPTTSPSSPATTPGA